jgi:hypothetical protein
MVDLSGRCSNGVKDQGIPDIEAQPITTCAFHEIRFSVYGI